MCIRDRIEPLPDNSEDLFEFINSIFGGAIPAEHIPACEKGFQDVMIKGPLAAFPMVNIKVTLTDGKYHDVDSSDLAYRLASRQAMKQAVNKAQPILLEPIMKVEVSTPDEYQGELMGDLNRRRGQIQGMETRGTVCVIDAFVPLENMFGYSTDMRSLSSGRADYSMTPSHFEQVPQSLVEGIVATSSREPART